MAPSAQELSGSACSDYDDDDDLARAAAHTGNPDWDNDPASLRLQTTQLILLAKYGYHGCINNPDFPILDMFWAAEGICRQTRFAVVTTEVLRRRSDEGSSDREEAEVLAAEAYEVYSEMLEWLAQVRSVQREMKRNAA